MCTAKKSSIHSKLEPNWWNKQIADCLRDKRDAFNKLKSHTNNEARARFTELRRKAKKLIKKSKWSTEVYIANQSKTNPKEFYNFIRQKRVVTSTVGPMMDANGDFTNDEEQISSILNTFFASVFTAEDLSVTPVVPAVLTNNDAIL